MEELIQEIEIPMNMSRAKAVEYLLRKDKYLINAEAMNDENNQNEGIVLKYDVTGLNSLEDVQVFSVTDRYRLLANVAEMHSLCNRYNVSLSPMNIYADINLETKLVAREMGVTSDELFLYMYKSLVGAILNSKYSYQDYYEGGSDLFAKSKRTAFISEVNSIDELKAELLLKYEEEIKFHKDNFMEISKQGYKSKRILFPILVFLATVSFLLSGYLLIFELPLKSKLIEANSYFLKNDYLNAEKSLESISLSRIPYESKYILAVSYLKTVDLSQEEKANEMLQITTNTQEMLFDYWIHIGRMEYENAVDDAQRLNSDSHLFYAYVCYRKSVENDLTISGSEKTELLSSLSSEIERLRETLTVDETEVAQIDESGIVETVEETTLETTIETEAETVVAEEAIETEETLPSEEIDIENDESVEEE